MQVVILFAVFVDGTAGFRGYEVAVGPAQFLNVVARRSSGHIYDRLLSIAVKKLLHDRRDYARAVAFQILLQRVESEESRLRLRFRQRLLQLQANAANFVVYDSNFTFEVGSQRLDVFQPQGGILDAGHQGADGVQAVADGGLILAAVRNQHSLQCLWKRLCQLLQLFLRQTAIDLRKFVGVCSLRKSDALHSCSCFQQQFAVFQRGLHACRIGVVNHDDVVRESQ